MKKTKRRTRRSRANDKPFFQHCWKYTSLKSTSSIYTLTVPTIFFLLSLSISGTVGFKAPSKVMGAGSTFLQHQQFGCRRLFIRSWRGPNEMITFRKHNNCNRNVQSSLRSQLHSSPHTDAGAIQVDGPDERRENTDSRNKNSESIRRAKHQQLMEASRLSLAPMMEYTDRHFRHLVRLISNHTLLYTEMVSANALAHERQNVFEKQREQLALLEIGHSKLTAHQLQEAALSEHQQLPDNYNYLRRFLGQGDIDPLEGPSVLQLGGSDPDQLYEGVRAVMDLTELGYCDYTALNLNCGCPSPKVAGKGCFGAALMDDNPRSVAKLARAMHDGSDGRLPVTIKCRIGTDTPYRQLSEASQPDGPGFRRYDDDEGEFSRLCHFIETIAGDGIVTDFVIHARIAVLSKSFSPSDNRKIPPLKYHLVRRLVERYGPQGLTFSLNGGVKTLSQTQTELEACPGLNGVMVGRAWTSDPWSFAMTDKMLYNTQNNYKPELEQQLFPRNRLQILEAYGRHADHEESIWDPAKVRRFVVKAVTPLFTGEPRAKKFRIALDNIASRPKLQEQGIAMDNDPPLSELIMGAALKTLSEETLYRSPEESYELLLLEEERLCSGKITVSFTSSGSS